jgi:hypothetical protein
MYLKPLILLSFLVIFSFENFGQNNLSSRIFIAGIVMEKDSLKPLPETNIIVNRSHGSISDSYGHFSFWGNHMDTLLFTRIGYKSFTFIIPDTLTGNEFIAGIFLSKDTLMLSEVIVYPRESSQLLKNRFINHNNIDKDAVNATKNLKITAYQSVAYSQENDAEASQKMVLDQQIMHNEYKGLISPDKMVNITAVLSIPYELIKKQKMVERLKINILEEDYIREAYKKRKKK